MVGWGSGRVVEQQDQVEQVGVVIDPLLRARSAPAPVVEALYRSERVSLTRLATAITLDRSLAEEIVQDAFAGLFRRRVGVENPAAYLHRSVVNLCLKALRRRKVASRLALDPAPVTGIPELDETWSVVMTLPARQRAVVVLRFWCDLGEADIAQVMGWPAGTVKSTLHRALRELKEKVTR